MSNPKKGNPISKPPIKILNIGRIKDDEFLVVEEYTYDNNGNRVSSIVNGVTTSAYYTLDDNLEVYGNDTYRYDEDGYLVEVTTPNETRAYTYNTLGALTEVITPSKTIIYHLDANNQRVAKEVDGVITEKYLWRDLITLLAIYDANDNLIQRFEYADSRMPISMTQDNQKYYLHYDQVGTLRAVSDTNHNIIKEVTYDTFGNILQDTNKEFKVPFGFAGGLHDRDTNLVHFGYREYDPLTGKWTAKDPIDFDGGDSNLYGYVLNDPINFIDPMGLSGFDNRNGGHGRNRTSGSTYGPFGPLCGSGPSAGLIPDISPDACQKHDDCYENCNYTKRQCDLELFFSNPIYGAAVIMSPASQVAYDNAQR